MRIKETFDRDFRMREPSSLLKVSTQLLPEYTVTLTILAWTSPDSQVLIRQLIPNRLGKWGLPNSQDEEIVRETAADIFVQDELMHHNGHLLVAKMPA